MASENTVLRQDGAYCDNGVPCSSDGMKLGDVSKENATVLEIDESLRIVHGAVELVVYCMKNA